MSSLAQPQTVQDNCCEVLLLNMSCNCNINNGWSFTCWGQELEVIPNMIE